LLFLGVARLLKREIDNFARTVGACAAAPRPIGAAAFFA
jgi:hypothetical protein